MTMRLIATLGLVALLTGCVGGMRDGDPAPVSGPGTQPASPPDGIEVKPYVPPAPPPGYSSDSQGESARPVPNRAVQVLLRRSEDQIRDGELDAAAASLERAIRISPREPMLWSRLATLRERQGKFAQAADLAAKSNSLLGDSDPALSRDNWWLIARSRRAVGDLAGARVAERKAVAQRLPPR